MDRFSGDLLPMAGLTWFHEFPLVWCRAQPCGQIFPSRWHKPSQRQEIHRGAQTRLMEMRMRVVEAPANLVVHSRMPLRHLQIVSPTCPVSEPSLDNKLALRRPRPPSDNGKLATFQNRKLAPRRVAQRRNVVGRESGAQIRMHNAKIVVCSGSRTMEEQQPCTLEILDMGDLVHQSVVFDRQLRQFSAHKVFALMWEAPGRRTSLWRRDR